MSAPLCGVTKYCVTVLPPRLLDPKFVTNIQLSSARIAIALGPIPVATVAGDDAVRLPEIGLILSTETVLESVPTT